MNISMKGNHRRITTVLTEKPGLPEYCPQFMNYQLVGGAISIVIWHAASTHRGNGELFSKPGNHATNSCNSVWSIEELLIHLKHVSRKCIADRIILSVGFQESRAENFVLKRFLNYFKTTVRVLRHKGCREMLVTNVPPCTAASRCIQHWAVLQSLNAAIQRFCDENDDLFLCNIFQLFCMPKNFKRRNEYVINDVSNYDLNAELYSQDLATFSDAGKKVLLQHIKKTIECRANQFTIPIITTYSRVTQRKCGQIMKKYTIPRLKDQKTKALTKNSSDDQRKTGVSFTRENEEKFIAPPVSQTDYSTTKCIYQSSQKETPILQKNPLRLSTVNEVDRKSASTDRSKLHSLSHCSGDINSKPNKQNKLTLGGSNESIISSRAVPILDRFRSISEVGITRALPSVDPRLRPQSISLQASGRGISKPDVAFNGIEGVSDIITGRPNGTLSFPSKLGTNPSKKKSVPHPFATLESPIIVSAEKLSNVSVGIDSSPMIKSPMKSTFFANRCGTNGHLIGKPTLNSETPKNTDKKPAVPSRECTTNKAKNIETILSARPTKTISSRAKHRTIKASSHKNVCINRTMRANKIYSMYALIQTDYYFQKLAANVDFMYVKAPKLNNGKNESLDCKSENATLKSMEMLKDLARNEKSSLAYEISKNDKGNRIPSAITFIDLAASDSENEEMNAAASQSEKVNRGTEEQEDSKGGEKKKSPFLLSKTGQMNCDKKSRIHLDPEFLSHDFYCDCNSCNAGHQQTVHKLHELVEELKKGCT